VTSPLDALRRLGRALVDCDAKGLASFHARMSADHGPHVDAHDAAVAEVNVARREVDELARAIAGQP
jgi:homogentisate 1,2-dioxygenase